jgi:hypothetical protein
MRLLKDLGITSLLCVGERLLERFMFPGLHRLPDRMASADPSRADDLATFLAEAIGLFALVWVFNGSLYAISYLSRRPLKPQAVMLVTLLLLVLVFASAYTQYASTPPAR